MDVYGYPLLQRNFLLCIYQVWLPCASQPSSAVSSLDTCTPTACSQRLRERPKRFPVDMATNQIMLGIKPSTVIRNNLDPSVYGQQGDAVTLCCHMSYVT